LRNRLYEAYASEHAGCGASETAALIYRRDIRPALPPCHAGSVIDIDIDIDIDIGCGQGEFVRLLSCGRL
jgi:hypothetical protein